MPSVNRCTGQQTLATCNGTVLSHKWYLSDKIININISYQEVYEEKPATHRVQSALLRGPWHFRKTWIGHCVTPKNLNRVHFCLSSHLPLHLFSCFCNFTWSKRGLYIIKLVYPNKYWKLYTVKPVLSDHPTVQGKMVVIDRWSLKQGFPETDRFFEALLNSCEHCGTHTFDLRNDNSRQSDASGGLMRWFSRKLALWWLFRQ